ncbi:wall-associated receptor kinase 3-like [Hordeum vulgare subsp. vulgare]|uniref:Protein kinase domain-containing protein n=1 Tax=Hordeum vulgare subsp. vulgare TaxID=112509 RepID=A0A8I6XVE1_HORVV|nr:wall-associated receptor kinase 3-like [Hordeum vulgare subsp. vulgare]
MAHIITILGVVMAATAVAILTSPHLAGAGISPEEAQGMPNCDITCGNMIVPYPFGMGPERCYWPGFNLTCNRTSNPPRLLLGDGTLQVKEFSLTNWSTFVAVIRTGDIKVDGNGEGTLDGGLTTNGPYTISSNKLILTGCNVQATLKNGDVTVSSCSSVCENGDGPSHVRSTLEEGMQCSGNGCCQSDIVFDPAEVPGRLASSTSYDVQLKWFGWNRSADHQWPAHVFVARYDWFSHTLLQTDAPVSADAMQVPMLLDWEVVGHGAECSNVCKSKHRECIKRKRGYVCLCKDGYQGNPYITNGCKDIDECNERDPKCYGDCTNSDGKYDCRCPPGTHGDATKPDGCFINFVPGNCSSSCGDINVPYPFGIGSAGCYWPGFNLACNTSQRPPKLLLVLNEYPFHVTGISLENNTVRLSTYTITHIDPSDSTILLYSVLDIFSSTPYSLSTRNEFILSGCNIQATLTGGGPEVFISGCASFCPSNVSRTDVQTALPRRGRYCNGMGCCQANIPMSSGNISLSMTLKEFDKNDHQNWTTQPAYMVIAEEGWFDQQQLSNEMAGQEGSEIPKVHVPLVLQWEVVEGLPRPADMKSHPECPAEVARKLCKSKNSYCKRGSRGYLCQCKNGFDKRGSNPYLSDGCKGGRKPLSTGIYLGIGVSVGAGIILFVLAGSFTHKKFKHRRAQMLKQKFFEKNRGQLLQQLVSQRADIAERMIITLDELEKATNKFDKARELGGGGHGTVYKGILSDLHVVAIKKPKAAIQKEIDEFINEVAILSQINHRNVVKLYGCCLETEVPMLIYEFISNGTLYDHLHVDGPRSLSWNDRLRIAAETARSLAYLHSTASVPIIHRDIKSVNILLDDTLTAKVVDFGASRYVPVDRSGITTRVQGTRGYLDPMYFYAGRLTEKSDVYSFGVLLLELLTRKKPFSYISSEDEGLVAHFSTLFTQGNLSEIIDPQVMEEGGREMEEVAALAVMCITLRGEDRPSMKQVEIKLEGTQASRGHEEGTARNRPSTADGSRIKKLSRQYSMEEEFALSSRYPR